MWLRRTRLQGTLNQILRRSQSLNRTQESCRTFFFPDSYPRPGSEKNFWPTLPGKGLSLVAGLCEPTDCTLTGLDKNPWPGKQILSWSDPDSSIRPSSWHGFGDTMPHLGLTFCFRAYHWKLHKSQYIARIQGFLAPRIGTCG